MGWFSGGAERVMDVFSGELMSGNSQFVRLNRVVVLPIAIPAVGSAVTLRSLIATPLAAAGFGVGAVMGWRISPILADRVTQRPAMSIGHSLVDCVSTYALAATVECPTTDVDVFVGGVAGAIANAVVELHIK